MSLRDNGLDAAQWKLMKAHPGYTDEEMKVFRENPMIPPVASKTVVEFACRKRAHEES